MIKFIDIFHRHVSEQPDHLALLDKNGELTYRQLEDKAEALAHEYKDQGVGEGDAVCVRVPYCKDIMVHAIALMKIGAVYVPVDSSYPEDRVRYMMEDSNREKHDSDVALILYTSGTTGRPKGVVHTHQSLMSMVQWPCNHLPVPMSPDTRYGVVTGFTFVATTQMLFSTIAAGGTLCFASDEERKDMNMLNDFIKRHAVTHTFLSASLGMAILETYDTTGTLVMVGGEKLRSFKSIAGQKLLNCYGSTEGVMVCSAYVDGTQREIPIGLPNPGVKTRIINEDGADVACGEIGELIYTAGFMAREYLHLSEQTSEKWFLVDGVRYYHTGDRVHQDADGNIYCLGRTDNMVKVRGFRVETGEVERQIAMVVPQTELVVVLRSVHGMDHLVCFYQSATEVDSSMVQKEISKYLADYMIPDIWVRVDCLPRNVNGKVDRKELPTPTISHDKMSVAYNEVEMRVLEAAMAILGEVLTLDDNFFECGGSSLSAIKLAAQLRQMGIDTTGSQIMQLKVLRKIAACAEVNYERLWTEEQFAEICDAYSKRGETIEKILPLTNAQEDCLFEYLMNPSSAMSRNVFMLNIDSHLDQGILRKTINDIAQQYECMRTSVVIHHHYPFQQVVTNRSIALDYNILNDERPALGTIKDIYHHLLHGPFDPEWSSSLRVVYVEDTTDSAYLIVQANTIILSMHTIRVVLHELMSRLSGYYPEDMSIRDWQELMQQAIENDNETKEADSAPGSVSVGPAEQQLIGNNGHTLSRERQEGGPSLIRTYSPMQAGKPSVVFVHTANTGSDAYYRLADRIGDYCGFAVIEPYNLYHQDDIQHGIEAIATKYIEILRDYQPEGPYILGGWCYGGVIAHEMACQLEEQGFEVKHLIQFDAHALSGKRLLSLASDMHYAVDRSYFEECPLFQDLRDHGMLEAMMLNYSQVIYDILHHAPKHFNGPLTYFKPMQTPMDATGRSLEYWQEMMEYDAGNFEKFCNREKLQIVEMPHEHDLMMDDDSLAVSVPVLLKIFGFFDEDFQR